MLGFAVKVGLVPVQVWLPRGYAAAPGQARAVMAGVAVERGFLRPVAYLRVARAAAGLADRDSAGGSPGSPAASSCIAHAAVQTNLPRVIAYSSVENTGLIVVGFCVALVGATAGNRRLVAAGLLAATLQVIAHIDRQVTAVHDPAPQIEAAARTGDLDALRG